MYMHIAEVLCLSQQEKDFSRLYVTIWQIPGELDKTKTRRDEAKSSAAESFSKTLDFLEVGFVFEAQQWNMNWRIVK